MGQYDEAEQVQVRICELQEEIPAAYRYRLRTPPRRKAPKAPKRFYLVKAKTIRSLISAELGRYNGIL